MARILVRSIPAAALGLLLCLRGGAAGAEPLVLALPGPWLAAGSIHSVSASGAAAGATLGWCCRNGALLSGQGTGTITFQAGAPGPLVLTCAAPGSEGAPAAARFTVLPPPGAEIFAQPRMHVGDSFPASMPAPFIRSWLWDPVSGPGTLAPRDAAGSVVTVNATAPGRFRLTGTVEDLAQSSSTASAAVDVVQGDFANPGGVMAEQGAATAARLRSGRVLVVGEDRRAGLFDPATGTWRPAEALGAGHGAGHAETLLADGTVLVTGGAGAPAVAERYDPATGQWTPQGDLVQGRQGHTATLLEDGTVLAVGGTDGDGRLLADPERFDPATGRWTILAPAAGMVPAARCRHTATLLADGRVLVAGGFDRDGAGLRSAERYDPADNSWSPAAELNVGRGRHSANLLPGDGSVLVAGGSDGTIQLASAERYDPVRNAWTLAAALASPRDAHGAAALAGGRVLVVGGESGSGVLGSAEAYAPGRGPGQGDAWTPQGPLLLPRAQCAALALADGRVLVAGGRNLSSVLGCPELYDPGTRAWTPAGGGSARARCAHTATLLGDGTVLVAGGFATALATAGAQRYDPSAGSWSDTGTPMASPRISHTATPLPDGTVLVAGGYDDGANLLASAERYDPAADRWSFAGTMAWARALHSATLLADGMVLVAGGLGAPDWSPQDSAELFDGSLWTQAPPLGTARYAHTATALGDGTVLVAGGLDADGAALASAERFDPAAGAWTGVCGPLQVPRYGHTATRLDNGKVLVAGGFTGGSATASAELFDPATGAWTVTGSLAAARGNHTATLVDGKVLVAGGSDLHGQLAGAERYDPASGSWSAAGLLDSPRDSHSATLLQDGATVAVFGGEPLQANLELWK